MPADLDNSAAEGNVSSSSKQMEPSTSHKKKRNLPRIPDPNAEVIALSPNTLMATNRFICEICNKGFKRDQNLQLHRRGHNLPWKLKHKSSDEIRKRVYVCPEESCVHHDPSRALGDLTGIKKHFGRKHGEKKWKCDRCLKNYAVRSDWKAHSKICGTREYKCDCGTLFSRRDSFVTHRAYCDALAVETAREQPAAAPPCLEEEPQIVGSSHTSEHSIPTSTAAILPDQSPELHKDSIPNTTKVSDDTPSLAVGLGGSCSSSSSNISRSSSVFASLFASSMACGSMQSQTTEPTNLIQAISLFGTAPPSTAEPASSCLKTNLESTYKTPEYERRQCPVPPATSATALLQKVAQVGASNTSLLTGFGIVSSTTSQQELSDSASMAAGLRLGLPYDGGSGSKELMMESPSVFGPRHTTLDFLGLGMAAAGGPTRGLSAMTTSISGSLDVATTTTSFGSKKYSGEEMGRSS